jgi:hypothetical protein
LKKTRPILTSGDQEIAPCASDHLQDVGKWQHAAIVLDENSFTH